MVKEHNIQIEFDNSKGGLRLDMLEPDNDNDDGTNVDDDKVNLIGLLIVQGSLMSATSSSMCFNHQLGRDVQSTQLGLRRKG